MYFRTNAIRFMIFADSFSSFCPIESDPVVLEYHLTFFLSGDAVHANASRAIVITAIGVNSDNGVCEDPGTAVSAFASFSMNLAKLRNRKSLEGDLLRVVM